MSHAILEICLNTDDNTSSSRVVTVVVVRNRSETFPGFRIYVGFDLYGGIRSAFLVVKIRRRSTEKRDMITMA